jgi:RNA methyltransferase, TrmH family
MAEKITSLQNPRIKNVVRLSKMKERMEQNLIVVEGFREISLALGSGFEVKELYYSREVQLHPDATGLFQKIQSSSALIEVSRAVFEKIAYRDNSDGLIALVTPKYLKPEKLLLTDNPLLLVIESVEKPGNLGAILRTADAAAIDAVVVCDPQTDIYNPNVIRSSLGCVFTKQIVTCTTPEAQLFLKQKGIRTFAAVLTAKAFYHESDFRGPAAIIMGSESEGLTDLWLHNADNQVKIPMCGKVDSLNVSTSAAILVFEAKRQRGFR